MAIEVMSVAASAGTGSMGMARCKEVGRSLLGSEALGTLHTRGGGGGGVGGLLPERCTSPSEARVKAARRKSSMDNPNTTTDRPKVYQIEEITLETCETRLD